MPQSVRRFAAVKTLADTITLTPKVDENMNFMETFSKSFHNV